MHIDSSLLSFILSIGAYFPIDIIISFLLIIFLLFCSAMISGSDIAFFSLTPAQITDIKEFKTSGSKKIIQLIEKPKLLLATVLIVNTFVNITIVIVSTHITAFYTQYISYPLLSLFIQIVFVTFLLLLIGEIIPKIFAQRHALQFAQLMAQPLVLLRAIFYPLSNLMVKSTFIIDKRISKKGLDISSEDFAEAVELSAHHESTSEEEKKMLKGIAKFSDIEVKEIMKSRIDVVAVEDTTPFLELLEVIKESGYSRIPVYKETFDSVEGILYVKDLLQHLEKDNAFNWQTLVRDAFFVPENKKIDDLLKEFQSKKIHLSIVVDEYGGTAGIVTLEDIIEEIVGEINDEFDTKEVIFTKVDDNTYFFEAKTSLNDFCKILEIDDAVFEDIRGGADSLAGLILELLKKIPQKNDSVKVKNMNFIIDTVDKRRIRKIKLVLDLE